MAEVKLFNVIECVDNEVISVESLVVDNEDYEDVVHQFAKDLYEKKAQENGAPSDWEEFDSKIGYERYTNENYSVQIVKSVYKL